MPPSQDTQYTLIQRAFNTSDNAAWDELVEHYKRFIYYVLKQIGVRNSDIEDITQKVLMALTKSLPNYDRSKGRFRSWLSTVIRNIALTHLKEEHSYKQKVERLEDPLYLQQLEQSERTEQIIEKEWATYISTQALERVRKIFKGQAVEVFELSLNGLNAEAIAKQTDLTISTVYTLKKRVKKRLYLEILELTKDLEP